MENSLENNDIVIVGAGICGLATVLALHRKGIRSIVIEKSERLTTTGVGIIIQPNGWRALDHLDVASSLRHTALPILSAYHVSIDDGKRKEIPIGGEMRCLRRMDVIKALAENLPPNTVHFGRKVLLIKLDPSTSYPILHLHDGAILKPKIVIGCDGVNSVVANSLGFNPTKSFSTSAVRGFTYYTKGHDFGSEFLLHANSGVQLGQLPITNNLIYWFATWKWTSHDDHCKISREQTLIKESTVEAMRKADFPKQTIEMVQMSDVNSLHLGYIRYRAAWDVLGTNFRRGTTMVAGDALHAMGPFIAQGGSTSLEDAVVLARCLSQKITLNEERRLIIGQKMVEEALDEYTNERRMRVFWLSLETYLVGMTIDASSLFVKVLCILLLKFLFRDPIANTRYDCTKH